jgi:transcriptional regulator with XRE-family HTH domain
MEIDDEIFYNIVQDFKKKNITTKQKGELIKAYIEENNISAREFGRRFEIPHSTVQDYLSLRQKDKYHSLLHIQNNPYTIADRLFFILQTKEVERSDKLVNKLKELHNLIEELLEK